MGFDLKEWFGRLQTEEVVLSHKGDFTSELITNVLEVVESKLAETEPNGKLVKTVYNVLVECLQNIYHHSLGNVCDAASTESKYGAFVLFRTQGVYRIVAGNFVRISLIQLLKDRMDQINSLTKDELKALYKLILNNEEFSEKGGGGLGLIDIARKTGAKLEYNFFDYNNTCSFYTLTINIANINN
jgi:hypothetical protein